MCCFYLSVLLFNFSAADSPPARYFTKEQGAHTHYGKRTQGVYTLGLNGVVKNGLLNLHWRSIFFHSSLPTLLFCCALPSVTAAKSDPPLVFK
jgi:hypothetical protein